jgi:hypothetical protein
VEGRDLYGGFFEGKMGDLRFGCLTALGWRKPYAWTMLDGVKDDVVS